MERRLKLHYRNNIITYNNHDILMLCDNVNQMLDAFEEQMKILDEYDYMELMMIFEGTPVRKLIKQISDKKKKKTSKTKKELV